MGYASREDNVTLALRAFAAVLREQGLSVSGDEAVAAAKAVLQA